MELLVVLAVGFGLYLFGRVLVRRLGWPVTVDGAAKWGLALLAVAAAFVALPEVSRDFGPHLGAAGATGTLELLAVLVVVGLGVVGYVTWLRRASPGAGRAERLGPRRRALPPPPEHEDAGAGGFTVMGPGDDG